MEHNGDSEQDDVTPKYESPRLLPVSRKYNLSLEIADYEGQEARVVVLKLLENLAPCITHLVGAAGTGKTTLLQDVVSQCKQAALYGYEIVIPVNMTKFVLAEKCESIDDLLKVADMPKDIFDSVLQAVELGKDNTLFVFDHLQYFLQAAAQDEKKFKKSIVAKILKREVCPNSTVLVSTRPIGKHSVNALAKVDHHLELLGFDKNQNIEEVLLQKCVEGPAKEQLEKFLNQFQLLSQLSSNPLYFDEIRKMFSVRHQNYPRTVSEVYSRLVVASIRQALSKTDPDVASGIQKVSDLPENYMEKFYIICSLAWTDLVDWNQGLFDKKSHFSALFSQKSAISSLKEVNDFGLFEPIVDENGHCIYSFHHLSLQEFLASFSLQRRPPANQLSSLLRHSEKLLTSHKDFFVFYFGQATLELQPSDSSSFINLTKISLPSTMQLLAYAMGLTNMVEGRQVREISLRQLLYLSQCIFEAQEISLWRKLIRMDKGIFEILVDQEDLSEHHKKAISSMIANAGMRAWKIQTPEAKRTVAIALKEFIDHSNPSSRVKVHVHIHQGSMIRVTPVSSRSRHTSDEDEPSDVAFFHKLCLKSFRGIFHRILQLNAPTQLKSDSSNPSYISYLTCKCLQDVFKSIYNISPPHAIHWLPSTAKQSSSSELTNDERHLLYEHDNNTLELVIMMTPYPKAVTFLVGGTEEATVVLYEDIQPSFMDGEIAKTAKKDIESRESLVPCIQAVNLDGPTETVYPNLPLPMNHEDESMEIPFTSHPTDYPESRERLHEHNGRTGSDNGAVVSTHPGAVNLRPHFNYHGDGGYTPSFVTQAENSNQPRKINPGAVLYTSMPREIPADQLHPLPDGNELIRRGGNGQIFAGTIMGMSVVYKKTHYRGKEFDIMIKMRHRNVLPLLAMILGDENPEHRRRYFCYHIVPRLTADLARMLTDREELTLKELHMKNKDNPRLMGIMIGNFKFILREILHGLSYLHSMCIAHRDAKPSNILLKFFCSCDHPLDCSCDIKYQVVISDFDAAVELDSNHQLLPVHHKATGTQSSFYHCVPVGTNTFRSPECSLLTVSNSVDCFSPPVSTKCDLWSFGMLVLRMMIGVEGPSGPRQMGMLVLKFHEISGRAEGHSRGGFLHVDDQVVEEMLKLPQLRREMKWLKHSSQFVELCLRLQPSERHSAVQLLGNRFLN